MSPRCNPHPKFMLTDPTSRYSYLSNQCLCILKVADKPLYNVLINSAGRALKLSSLTDSDKTKMYYRRALAHVQLKSDEDAEKDLNSALQLSPEDAAVKFELAKLAKKQQEKERKQRAAYSKMFA